MREREKRSISYLHEFQIGRVIGVDNNYRMLFPATGRRDQHIERIACGQGVRQTFETDKEINGVRTILIATKYPSLIAEEPLMAWWRADVLERDPLIEISLVLDDSDSILSANSINRYTEPGINVSGWVVYRGMEIVGELRWSSTINTHMRQNGLIKYK